MVTLFDDGKHEDGPADDGVYAGTYTNTTIGGMYDVSFMATGTYQGISYVRTAGTKFAIAPTTAKLVSGHTNRAVDVQGNGMYDWLEVGVPVLVHTAGTFTISADLYAGSTLIERVSKRVTLGGGTHSVPLNFNGFRVFLTKNNGPYTLRNVMLIDENVVSILIQTQSSLYSTKTYNYLMFDHNSLYLPLIQQQATN
jgi:hypothetical protein